ncbi:AcrR family transcriptional regulator [Haloferula luteola]|uniref:AcrR family transcriptional regulator n=1 Tax=Haloferula luteola TaxID=595692 RepID=A0A840V7J7_9BACT|nr:TetR/AcrR family transcriptional regulator [Haloferula luteola]MBB5353016.1 AcrR family transcriptional regulator [Haloferula luteola]
MVAMDELDPRVKRTRRMLFQALEDLLAEKEFDAISMQDLAERSTLNRGTIYLHFKDKFALLEAMIGDKFQAHFEARMAGAGAGCLGAVRVLILAVCDFFGGMGCREHRGPFAPIVEATVRGILREYLIEGLKKGDKATSCADAELRATAVSWAVCGTVQEWSREQSIPAEELAGSVLPLVAGTLYLD